MLWDHLREQWCLNIKTSGELLAGHTPECLWVGPRNQYCFKAPRRFQGAAKFENQGRVYYRANSSCLFKMLDWHGIALGVLIWQDDGQRIQFQVRRDTDDLLWEFHRTIQAPELFFVEWQGFRQIDTVPLNQREKSKQWHSWVLLRVSLTWRALIDDDNSSFR